MILFDLHIVGDDFDSVWVDLVLEAQVAQSVSNGLKVLLHGELLAGAVDDSLDLSNLGQI